MRLRILTYNMHKGFCFFTRQYVLDQLRDAIRASQADLVFLQEVMGVHPPRAQDMEIGTQFEYLADEIWAHYAYGKNAVYSDGHHGNAILSKFPIVNFENVNVSTNALESRGLLHAEIELNGKIVHAVCLHLDLLERGRKRQMLGLIDSVQRRVKSDQPLIIAGDFNDWVMRFSHPLEGKLGLHEAGVSHTGRHAKTFPSWYPLLSLDRVYLRRFEVRGYTVLKDGIWRKMSDHAAVLADVEMSL